MSSAKKIGLILEPLDVLFFRDGRPFGAATRAGTASPLPQTLAGAICTALLRQHDCDFDKLGRLTRETAGGLRAGVEPLGGLFEQCGSPRWIAEVAVRGPWLGRIPCGRADPACGPSRASCEVLVPTPASVFAPKKGREGKLQTLRPLTNRQLPGWSETPQGQRGLRPLWVRDRAVGEPAAGYLTPQGLRAFLRGETVPQDERLEWSDLTDIDHRTGIAIEPNRLTAAESMIYGASFLSLKRGVELGPDKHRFDVVFYAEVVVPNVAGESPLDGLQTLAWGGEGRRVAVRVTDPFPWQEYESTGGKPLLALTTPGLFADPARPAILNGQLVAAAVPGSVAVSGWDLARGGPKPNRFAAAAGSVYFLDRLPDSLPASLCDEAFDAQQGWGCYVKGTWTDE